MLASFRACYGVLRFVMESGAKGCEVCALAVFTYVCFAFDICLKLFTDVNGMKTGDC